MNGVRICAVAPKSPASHAGVRAGQYLLMVNGHEIRDVLDYMFYTNEPRLTLTLSEAGAVFERSLKHREGSDIGLSFDSFLMDAKRGCANNCLFCFVDQQPSGLRETLYFKDDDARLSFLHGSYITLTNITQREAERILSLRISPLHISVHTTNPGLRVRMLGHRRAGECLELLKRFAGAGLHLHTQIVLCPGINDGAELERSLSDLTSLGVDSVAVVPVGLTRYREGLYNISPMTAAQAKAAVELAERFDQSAKRGMRVVYAADELFLKAGLPMPPPEYYDDYPQLENGVGMTTMFTDDWSWASKDRKPHREKRSLATGTAAAPMLRELLDGLPVSVHAIRNDFWGESVNVAGLVTGQDIVRQLRGQDLGTELLIPSSMLRYEGDVFLDDVTPELVGRELGLPLRVVSPDAVSLADAVFRR